MKDFAHRNAGSVDEAVRLLRQGERKAMLNAGGTDLLGLLKDRVLPAYPETIVNIKGIRGLDYIREGKEGLRIGALAKLKHVAESPVVKEKFSLLADAAQSVANPQIRNMATIGGNLAQDVRCWYYRYPDQIGGSIKCLRKGGAVCNALMGDNRYHSIFGAAPAAPYPCADHCPAHTAIPAYLERIRNGEFGPAARMFADFNPMPAVTGRVCPVFCEPHCNRGGYDEPVAVRYVERSLGDYMLEHPEEVYTAPKKKAGKKAAIIGSGPAGLAAAFYLRRAGLSVTVYEKLPKAGGMLRYSIPPYRLPKDVVEKQVQALKGMGVVFRCNFEVGRHLTIDELSARFDAVLVAAGAWKERAQTLQGDGSPTSGLAFLKKVNEGDRSVPGKKVAVIGGGNVAVDVARTLIRLGAKPVIIYRRTRKEMPAFEEELEKAQEEGVVFRYLTLPTRAKKTGEKVILTCVKTTLGPPDKSGRRRPVTRPGTESTAAFDAVITATGEEPDYGLISKKTGGSNRLQSGNLYTAGDFKNGSTTVIEAIASGREAARTIKRGLGIDTPKTVNNSRQCSSAVYEPSPRLRVDDAPAAQRVSNIDREDRPGTGLLEVRKEARRCFNCGCLAVNPSDVGTALVALNGKVVTTKRTIDAEAFFTPNAGASTVLEQDEMITEIRVPPIQEGAKQHYSKFTLRKPVDFAVVSVASVLTIKDGVCTDARIVLGAVAPQPLRATEAEEMLRGRPTTTELLEEASKAALAGAVPLEKNGYKGRIVQSLVKRALEGK